MQPTHDILKTLKCIQSILQQYPEKKFAHGEYYDSNSSCCCPVGVLALEKNILNKLMKFNTLAIDTCLNRVLGKDDIDEFVSEYPIEVLGWLQITNDFTFVNTEQSEDAINAERYQEVMKTIGNKIKEFERLGLSC
jgi:hypothetical protein